MDPIQRDMELLSSSMATYAYIQANPESFALYFMMGVCFGLLLALCLLVTGVACTPRRHRPKAKATPTSSSPERRQLKLSSEEEEDESTGEDDDGEDSSEIPKVMVVPCMTGTVSSQSTSGTLQSLNVFASAEELERARRLEERERIVREIWRNGQPDILVTGTGTIGRVHYH